MENNSNYKASDIFSAYVREEDIAQGTFDDLAKLTAGITGTQVCLINLVDMGLQWTVGSFGIAKEHILAEESVCQYTVLQDVPLEVTDLSMDPRFSAFTSLQHSGIKYYYGVPLSSAAGAKIGALCILGPEQAALDKVQRSTLFLMAEQTARRLEELRALNEMRRRLEVSENFQATLAHDIRGPLAGISALSELAIDELNHAQNEELPQYLEHIKESGRSLLDLANGILEQKTKPVPGGLTDLRQVRRHLRKLFTPNAIKKRIALKIAGADVLVSLPKTNLLQAVANLVGNAIKFTPAEGQVAVDLAINKNDLHVSVCDNGVGISQEKMSRLLKDETFSTPGTAGEKGLGLGLVSVQNFAKNFNGRLSANSVPGKGTCFELILPDVTIGDASGESPALARAS